jgi:hypothetical protein
MMSVLLVSANVGRLGTTFEQGVAVSSGTPNIAPRSSNVNPHVGALDDSYRRGIGGCGCSGASGGRL